MIANTRKKEERTLRRYYEEYCSAETQERKNIAFERIARYIEGRHLYEIFGTIGNKAMSTQTGRISLWKALETYDPSKGAKLLTWIITKIKFGNLEQQDLDFRQSNFAIAVSRRAYRDFQSIERKIFEAQTKGEPCNCEALGISKKMWDKHTALKLFMTTHVKSIDDVLCSEDFDSEPSMTIGSNSLYYDDMGRLVFEIAGTAPSNKEAVYLLQKYAEKLRDQKSGQ